MRSGPLARDPARRFGLIGDADDAATIARQRQPAQVSPAVLAWAHFRTAARLDRRANTARPHEVHQGRLSGVRAWLWYDYRNLIVRIGHADATARNGYGHDRQRKRRAAPDSRNLGERG